MDGLRFAWSILATVCLCLTTWDGAATRAGEGAGTSANTELVPSRRIPENQPAAVCAVIGDVSAPNTFHCPDDQPFHLRDALNAAGMVSDSASVLLVRPTAAQPWTEFVSRVSADPGPPLFPGDIVVVHSDEHLNSVIQPTAVLVRNGRPLVLALRGDTGVPVLLADVLRHCELPPEQISGIQLISARPGRSRSHLDAVFAIQHGDVLFTTKRESSGINRLTGNRRTPRTKKTDRSQQFAPQVTEWSGPEEDSLLLASAASAAPSGLPAEPLTVPDSDTTPLSSVSAVSNTTTVFDTVTNNATGSEILTTAPGLLPPVDEFGHADLIDPFRPTRTIQESDEAPAPLPPSEVPLTASPATNVYWWNLMFIAGLMTAGGLIIFGWLKSEAELRAAMQEPPVIPRTAVESSNSDRSSLLNSEMLIHNSLTEKPVADALDFRDLKSSERLKAVSASELIDRQEWFEGSWMKTGEVVDVEPERVVCSDVPPAVAAVKVLPETPAPKPAPALNDFQDLNDLIANRLPVDLCEAGLPLRVNLFGRPAGPRRLRIDAAHTQLAGPHMPIVGERRQTEQAGVSGLRAGIIPDDSLTGGLSRSEGTMRVDSGRQRGSTATPSEFGNSESMAASLDRALNFLHEQGE